MGLTKVKSESPDVRRTTGKNASLQNRSQGHFFDASHNRRISTYAVNRPWIPNHAMNAWHRCSKWKAESNCCMCSHASRTSRHHAHINFLCQCHRCPEFPHPLKAAQTFLSAVMRCFNKLVRFMGEVAEIAQVAMNTSFGCVVLLARPALAPRVIL